MQFLYAIIDLFFISSAPYRVHAGAFPGEIMYNQMATVSCQYELFVKQQCANAKQMQIYLLP